MEEARVLEVWSDSFKEGEWLLDIISKRFYKGTAKVTYAHNFIPIYHFEGNGSLSFSAIVYGDYKGWERIPEDIADQLEYGKPDIFLYDPLDEEILLAVEETAAVPTGNQSLQRLERMWYAAHEEVPFAYLIAEYGLHKDGGVRRSSIWPTYLAMKLSSQYKVPSLTLLYGSSQSPENYDVGTGVELLSQLGISVIKGWLGEETSQGRKKILETIYGQMSTFVLSQYRAMASQLPATKILSDPEFAKFLVERSIR
ncbi:MAG: hypothetical protein JRN62_09495 [Nitrososphaerota archaeon]|nr:hypothetical protein [Nitrososphaerota archaeon]